MTIRFITRLRWTSFGPYLTNTSKGGLPLVIMLVQGQISFFQTCTEQLKTTL